jgi:N-acetyl-1-D-myo-inositol-2-amino-2-deoxy-alpha-D-glucopyranoside deacetylase
VATLLLVHAHPDDESIWTGGVTLQARSGGHRVVVVTATMGEEGERDPAAAAPGAPLAEVRSHELRLACARLGVDRNVRLGYRDSGLVRQPRPPAFAAVPLAEVAGRLVSVLVEERPDVVVTYDAGGTYGHPDHRRAHQATLAALDRLAGSGWRPRRVYLHSVPSAVVAEVRRLVDRAARAAPEMRSFLCIRGVPAERLTTVVDVRPELDGKLHAFAAHRSQYEGDRLFRETGRDVLEAAFGREAFALAAGSEARPPDDPAGGGLLAGL